MPEPTLEREDLRRTRRNFILALLGSLGAISFLMFRPFLSYVILGAILTYVFWPAQLALTKVVRRPGLAAGLLLALVFTIVLAPLAYIAFELTRTARAVMADGSAGGLLAGVDVALANLARLIGLPPPAEGASSALLTDVTLRVQDYLRTHIPDLLSVTVEILLGLLVMGFVLYYGLVEGASIVRYVSSVSPLTEDQNTHLFAEVRKTVDAVLYGQLVLSFAAGALGAFGYAVFGVPHPVFWGFVTFIFALLPVLGAPMVYVPATLWLLSTGSTGAAIGLLLFSFIFLNVLEHFIRPRLVGERAQMHPFLVLVGAIGGLAVFGFVGFIVGPIVLSLLVAVLNFWRKDYLPSYEAGQA